jgi:ankyrin repeat protein
MLLVVSVHAYAQQPQNDTARRRKTRAPVPVELLDIFGAAAAGELERVKELLATGATVNDVEPRSKDSPLLAALKNDKIDVAVFLLDSGADPLHQDRNNVTPLHWAANWGRIDLGERLLAAGADVDAPTRHGECPIHYATLRGQHQFVKFLIAHGANVNPVAVNEVRPIDLALRLGNPYLATVLVDAGANLTENSDRAVSNIIVAATKNWTYIVDKMLEQAEPDPALTQLLIDAAYEASIGPGHEELLLTLKNHSQGISDLTVASNSRLFQACASGSELLAITMLDEGLDPNEVIYPSGWTPLHAAMFSGNKKIVNALIEHGANVNAVDGMGRTALHLAVADGHFEVVQQLLSAKADPDAPDFKKETPVHYAAYTGNTPVLEALIAAGGSIKAKNDNGLLPLDIALQSGRSNSTSLLHDPEFDEPAKALPEGFDLLVRATATYQTAASIEQNRQELLPFIQNGVPLIHLAILQRSKSTVEQLLAERPASLSNRDPYGYLPLHSAANCGDLAIVEILLDLGADPNDAQNLAQWTPLHFASSAAHADVVRALLDKGANPAAADALGRTPAELLLSRESQLGKPLK